jgi:hypothetical protein
MNIANTNACRKTYLGKPQYNTFADHLVKKIGIAPMDYSPVKYAKTRRIVNDDVSKQVPDLRLIFTL